MKHEKYINYYNCGVSVFMQCRFYYDSHCICETKQSPRISVNGRCSLLQRPLCEIRLMWHLNEPLVRQNPYIRSVDLLNAFIFLNCYKYELNAIASQVIFTIIFFFLITIFIVCSMRE